MRALALFLGLACALGAQPAAERPFKIIKLDPALDEIISPDAKLETLGEHFGLSEGPVWVQHGGDGYLLFSDNAGNEIYKWSPHAPLSVFLQKSGYTGKDVMNVGAQTISGGGVLTGALTLIGGGSYSTFPTSPAAVTGGGLVGATVNLVQLTSNVIENLDTPINTVPITVPVVVGFHTPGGAEGVGGSSKYLGMTVSGTLAGFTMTDMLEEYQEEALWR